MPADDGLWFDDRQNVRDPWSKTIENNKNQSVQGAECLALPRLSAQHIELMAQGSDLDFPRGARSKQPGDDRPHKLE